MTYVKPRSAWLMLAAYTLGGIAVGFWLPRLKPIAASGFGRPGLAVAFVVNIAMPLLIVTLALMYPRLRVALPGTFLATIGFLLVGSQEFPRLSWDALTASVQQMHPILVVACVAYHVLAAATVLVVRPWRTVRATDPESEVSAG